MHLTDVSVRTCLHVALWVTVGREKCKMFSSLLLQPGRPLVEPGRISHRALAHFKLTLEAFQSDPQGLFF